jgi:hypothetical protein
MSPYWATFVVIPTEPLAWEPRDWDVSIYSRHESTWHMPATMLTHHGNDCGPPTATHIVNSYADAVFLCRGHLMTAINGAGYGLVYLTPAQLTSLPA